ncbi:peptidyl-prolyl isomerase CWC27 [Cryptococcus amylolentus CBS 6039]|uniref:Peptidyl-prolyl isomerase CWC27 n=1 Tax=Cryptococcus amylolentus CBS 6039 TaxID=1295533 RepID=A0A1E3HSZ0_9TREE|nr:peptidyl-prolyl isomerase CWC27 [Cryptococcus amylolentus CBS 6039]ODN79478.1 peptidyl-prolyl isomerase CWC27 [Cryptococcus amylolentus CBS 6039]
MSNLYATEPATNGKVIFDTTAGEIEVELWGKECPKAVKNFLALTMEGYYDGVIFHRVVPGFIIQTGDPTGTGMGGESFYGEPFGNEIHGRLKFNRRGLLGVANNGEKNTNTSQFFITLDQAPELTSKHTLFGKVVGNTIYNVLSIGNMDIDAEERPLVPPKIRRIRIIENPFPDIQPRITAEERRAQNSARIEAKKELEKREKRSKAKKNTKLLSFGESEEIPDEDEVPKKSMTRQDLMEVGPPANDFKLRNSVDVPPPLKDIESDDLIKKKEAEKKAIDLKSIREQHAKDQAGGANDRKAEIARMEADLKRLKKRSGSMSSSSSSSSTRGRRPKGPSVLEQELAKYEANRGRAAQKTGKKRGRKEEEDDLLAEMKKFSHRVVQAGDSDGEEGGREEGEAGETKEEKYGLGLGEDDEGVEVDDDVGWMRHTLKFVVDEKELTRRAEDEYAVIDPRAKARDIQSASRPSAKRSRQDDRRHGGSGRGGRQGGGRDGGRRY